MKKTIQKSTSSFRLFLAGIALLSLCFFCGCSESKTKTDTPKESAQQLINACKDNDDNKIKTLTYDTEFSNKMIDSYKDNIGNRVVREQVIRMWGLNLMGRIGDLYRRGSAKIEYKVSYRVTEREPVPDKDNPNRCKVFVKAKSTLVSITPIDKNKLEPDEQREIEISLSTEGEEELRWTLEKIKGKWRVVQVECLSGPKSVTHID